MHRRILVAVSEGAVSEPGVAEGMRLACTARASPCFVRVVDEGQVARANEGFAGTTDEFLDLLASLDRSARSVAGRARQRANVAGGACVIAVRRCAEGGLSEAVAAEAVAWRGDAIAMGVDDLDPCPASAGARILRGSPVPVMAVLSSPRHRIATNAGAGP